MIQKNNNLFLFRYIDTQAVNSKGEKVLGKEFYLVRAGDKKGEIRTDIRSKSKSDKNQS